MAARMPAAPADIHAHRILILDFGAQYTQLIARRVREIGVYCEILPWDCGDEAVRAFGARGIILSGGPESVTDAVPPRAPEAVFTLKRAGARHLLRHADDGRPARRSRRAVLAPRVRLRQGAAHRGLAPARRHRGRGRRRPGLLDVWMSHGDRVEALPPGFTAIAATANAPLAAMANDAARLLRRAVPPGSDAHALGRGDPRALRARHLRLRRALGRRQHRRRRDRARARTGRPRPRAARPVGRRRLVGRRGAAAPGDRRPAHLRLRGPRAAAARRGRPGHGDLRRAPRHPRDPRGRRGPLLRGARGRGGPGAQAQDHRQAVHRGVRGGVAQDSRA